MHCYMEVVDYRGEMNARRKMRDYIATRRMYPVSYRGKQARVPRLLMRTELGVAELSVRPSSNAQ